MGDCNAADTAENLPQRLVQDVTKELSFTGRGLECPREAIPNSRHQHTRHCVGPEGEGEGESAGNIFFQVRLPVAEERPDSRGGFGCDSGPGSGCLAGEVRRIGGSN